MTNRSRQRAQLESKAADCARQELQATTVDVRFSHFTSRMIVIEQLAYLDKFGPQPQGGQQRLPDKSLSWLLTRWVIRPEVHQRLIRESIELAILIEIADKALGAQRKDSPELQQLKIGFDSQNLGAKWARH